MNKSAPRKIKPSIQCTNRKQLMSMKRTPTPKEIKKNLKSRKKCYMPLSAILRTQTNPCAKVGTINTYARTNWAALSCFVVLFSRS